MKKIFFITFAIFYFILSNSSFAQTIELEDDKGKKYLCDLSSGKAVAVNKKNAKITKLKKKSQKKLKKESNAKKIKKLKKQIKNFNKHIKICKSANTGSDGGSVGGSTPFSYYCISSGMINVCYEDSFGTYTNCYPQTVNGISDQLFDNINSAAISSKISCGSALTSQIILANINGQGSKLQDCEVVQCYYCQQPNC